MCIRDRDCVVDMSFAHGTGHSFHCDGVLEHYSFPLILLVFANYSVQIKYQNRSLPDTFAYLHSYPWHSIVSIY